MVRCRRHHDRGSTSDVKPLSFFSQQPVTATKRSRSLTRGAVEASEELSLSGGAFLRLRRPHAIGRLAAGTALGCQCPGQPLLPVSP